MKEKIEELFYGLCSIIVSILFFCLVGLIIWLVGSFYYQYSQIWDDYPTCRYSRDPMMCVNIVKMKR
nr:MAG TPA: potassium channel accessory sub-unit protein 4 [Caudoviricetes sp.]